jgi:hypothetical protein
MDLNKTKGGTKSMNNSNEGQTKQTNPVCLKCPLFDLWNNEYDERWNEE